jgi:dTDP-4-amino-4,6-dideoxygalactose transaminase
LETIRTIAEEGKLIVIEDACHALGAEFKGRKIGSLSDMTVLSFHPVKHISTGEGGMILTDKDTFYEKLRIFRHHGIVKDTMNQGSWHYEIYDLGFNFRITDFQCALGISQLKKLDRFVERRREIAALYNRAFAEIEEIITPMEGNHVKAAYHIYVIQLRTEMLKGGRKEIFEALRAENIGVNVHYVPVHLHPFYQSKFGYKRGDYPRAERYYRRAMSLPVFPKMKNSDVKDVIKALSKVICYYRR